MRTIEIRPTRKHGGGWVAYEAVGIQPVFPGQSGKHDAISYAKGRFGGGRGEIHVYDDSGEAVIETIPVDDKRYG